MAEAYNDGLSGDVLADELTAWLYLLARGYRSKKEVDAIVARFPTIEEFAVQYGIAIDDPDIRRTYEAYRESEMEWNSAIREAQREASRKVREESIA